MPRYDQSFSGLCEQNLQDTLHLKQRFLDTKTKRVPKTKEKKQDGIQSSVHVQKFLKRSADELETGNPIDNFEQPVKLQCTAQQHGTNQNEGLTKFSVEIVQQLEFTTSAANSQPQQISTNVTVKTHANASVKSDISSPKAATPGTPGHASKANIGLDVGTLVECVKQEPDNDFADLDQCAAALEKDAANGGAGFGDFPDLMGDDTSDAIMSSAAFNDLISDISSYNGDLMKDFDFEAKPSEAANSLKLEEKDLQPAQVSSESLKTTQSPSEQSNQANYSLPVFEKNPSASVSNRLSYPNMDFAKTELSPAAQTLKQMAEQHQHKNQMGLNFNPNSRVPNARSPYSDFQFQGDYGSPSANQNYHKNSPSFPQPDMIKQEMIYQGNEYDMKRKQIPAAGVYPKQKQYSPYGSPGPGGSPGFLPSGRGSCPPPNAGQYNAGTPPRPPSGSGNGNPQGPSGTSVQINQAQQLNINQHGPIQVSAGQHLHLSADVKGNVSIAAQQGMQFTHGDPHGSQGGSAGAQQQAPMSSAQHSTGMSNNAQSTMNQNASQMGGNMNSIGQQMSGPQGGLAGMQNASTQPGMPSGTGMQGGPAGMQGTPPGMGGMMGGPNMGHSNVMGGHVDSYSMSQTQTINFTQQTLRRATGPTAAMGGSMSGVNVPQMGPVGGPMAARMMSNQMMEQQKLQQILRSQQAMQQQQQQQLRPPPPDYKTSAGLGHGMQPRYGGPAPPPNMRRIPHQPIPPSGPMIRSQVYMMQQQQHQQQQQQQQMSGRATYARQAGPMGGMEAIQQNSDWRHVLMSQQQNANFVAGRPAYQGNGFNMNMGGPSMQQMTALQHQQQQHLRAQQASMGAQQGGLGHMMGAQGGPMAQMNSMNQAMLHMQQQQQQQQQQSMMQQQNPQMSMTNIHMQQSQSISVNNHSLSQPQQNMNNMLANSSVNSNAPGNSLATFNPQATDFTFEFLENLAGTADAAPFSDQELLNSFDTDAAFNLDF
ncbi:neurogenic protein mastermind isoform X3 [Dendroctonus ponderosae]|uniref:neurogenic protein mastermind isoform X3 n=1 Tax=Dendroctonus ponderosae TaxID=77166 RepID=UPI0020355A79|nr:neurogenic protein mastermind isoform X3 [Dendroctonus ponderosae]